MSAYIVEDETINKIIAKLNELDRKDSWLVKPLREIGYIGMFGDTLGNAMYNLNCRSIVERYGEGEDKEMAGPIPYTFGRAIPTTNIQAYKSLQCYLYQSCEGNCDEDKLYLALDEIKARLAEHIVYELPAYDKAIWG